MLQLREGNKMKLFKKKYYLGDQSRFLPKQKLHFLLVPHEGSLWSAIKWWMFNKNKHCHSFCPTCEYYYRCQEDIAMEEFYIESPALRKGRNK